MQCNEIAIRLVVVNLLSAPVFGRWCCQIMRIHAPAYLKFGHFGQCATRSQAISSQQMQLFQARAPLR